MSIKLSFRSLVCVVLGTSLFLACSSNSSDAPVVEHQANDAAPPFHYSDAAADVSSDADAAVMHDAALADASEEDATPSCLPINCLQANAQCGEIGDGCGNALNCGVCPVGEMCMEGNCVPPPCMPKTCTPTQCGSMSDGCTGTLDCGQCPTGEVCLANNSCCTPETDAAFCATSGKNCGPLTATDNCGTSRTVPDCGSCPTNQTCSLAGASTGTCGNYLIDHGGLVMATVNLYAIYWGGGFEATTSSLYESFMTGIGGSNFATINSQYLRGAASNISYKLSVADLTTPIPIAIMDADLHSEINRVLAAKQLPYDPNGFYFVFTPKTTTVCASPTSCSCTTFCGYHSFYTDSSGRPVVYATVNSALACPNACGVIPSDALAPNGNQEADDGVSIIAHELMEAQSDSNLNAWYDSSNPPNEVADKCSWQFGTISSLANGAPYNQTWSGRFWLVQENWSNAVNNCLQK